MAYGRPVTVGKVALCSLRNWLADNASTTAAALAFYSAFSLAPLLVLVLALTGWMIGSEAALRLLGEQLTMLLGDTTSTVVLDAVRNSRREEGWTAALVSTGALLIGATTVLSALDEALQRVLGRSAPAPSGIGRWFLRRVLSLGFIVALSFLLLVSLTISTAIAGLRSWVSQMYSPLLTVIGVLDLWISTAIAAGVFAVVFRYVPTQRLPWKCVIGGGLVTAMLFTLGKWGVGLYLAKSTVPSAFGAAASFATLLLWLYYNAQVFLLGAVFTACYSASRSGDQSRMAAMARTAAPTDCRDRS